MVEIIYSDNDIIVVNKPPDLSVHGGPQVRGETLVDFLLKEFPEISSVGDDPVVRPGIVHRLDKDTSGVMVVARNQKAFEALKEMFKKRQVEKTYWAIVCGVPKKTNGVINYPIGRIIRNPLKRGADLGKGGIRGARDAVTEYKILKQIPLLPPFKKKGAILTRPPFEKGGWGDFSLVELKPKTGRMHQLRVHLKSIGHPVACDKIYGGKSVCCPPVATRQLLHAKSLSFSFPAFADLSAVPTAQAGAMAGRPVGRKLFFEADPPEDFPEI